MSIIFVIIISIMVAGYTILKLKSKHQEIDSNNVEEKKMNSVLSILIGNSSNCNYSIGYVILYGNF